jgi:hypothetical protein
MAFDLIRLCRQSGGRAIGRRYRASDHAPAGIELAARGIQIPAGRRAKED